MDGTPLGPVRVPTAQPPQGGISGPSPVSPTRQVERQPEQNPQPQEQQSAVQPGQAAVEVSISERALEQVRTANDSAARAVTAGLNPVDAASKAVEAEAAQTEVRTADVDRIGEAARGPARAALVSIGGEARQLAAQSRSEASVGQSEPRRAEAREAQPAEDSRSLPSEAGVTRDDLGEVRDAGQRA